VSSLLKFCILSVVRTFIDPCLNTREDYFDLRTCLNHLSFTLCLYGSPWIFEFYMNLTVAKEYFDVAIGACWKVDALNAG